jgi:hypothetical protein
MRMFLVAVLCCFAYPSPSVMAEEEIKYQSPDGRFALRIVQPKDDEYHPMIDLIEKDSDKALVNLHDGSDSDAFDPSECVLVWSANSRRVAYGFRANPPGARMLELGTLVCVWNGSGFDRVFLPENVPQPDIKFPKGKGENVKPYGGGVRPLSWLKSGELEISNEEMMLTRDDGKSCTGVVKFTISFDAQHHASVKKVGKTKTEVSD